MIEDATPLEALSLELLRIPSVIGEEAKLAAHVESWAHERGMHRLVRAGDNLALQARPFREGAPRLLLIGHLDTVPPADDNPPRLDDERIFGLGSSDMKCADALILHVLERARTEQSRFDLAGILYAREEGPFDESGFPEIVEAAPDLFESVDLAIAMEPTDNHFELGCLGTLHALVRFHGRRAHSARPWEGKNAVHMAAPLLAHIAALEPRDCRYDGLLFREVCSATMVDYDGARNVIPGRFDLNLNFRFGPDRSRSEALAWIAEQVREAVGAHAIDEGAVTIEITDICPSGRVCNDNPLFRSLAETAGPSAETRAKQAWTDVGRLSEMGLDAINFGPGSGSQAHQAGEWCSRANLEAARTLLEGWIFA
ncbi:MAG: succinyl-diaminopimelate desuccinylase [Planctomycetota bacterium]|nr:succinyl-diaminopimelate desuccinylase [Planctomycetota bacterium]